jgi:hypothetical protein
LELAYYTNIQNPFNFSARRKAVILLVASFLCFCTAVNCTSVAITATWGTEWFGVDNVQFIASQTIMMIMVAGTPLLLAPLSEVVSRVLKV